MKTTQYDKEYCGVDKDKISTVHPLIHKKNFRLFLEFVRDRYEVHTNKDVEQLPKPWTDNPVLQQYKFTNIRREHDRQSKMYINGVAERNDLTLNEKILNAFMFRAWNNYDTFTTLGGPFSMDDILTGEAMQKARKIVHSVDKQDPNHLWFNSAYNQGSMKGVWRFPDGSGFKVRLSEDEAAKKPGFEPCMPLRMFYLAKYVINNHIIDRLLYAEDQKEAYEIIRSVPGFAAFMAYQVFVDLTYIEAFKFSENEFTMAGPGCKRGLDYLFSDAKGMSPEECLFWLRDNFDRLNAQFPDIGLDLNKLMYDLPEWDRTMNVMSLENCMCELSKYLKVVYGTGRPRCKYKGV